MMAACFASAQDLKIGWASRDIGTERPVLIPGQHYQRISEGVLDPLTVTALVIDNGLDCVIFLSVDITSVRYITTPIREKVAARNPEIPVLKILINATHTHTAGDTYPPNRRQAPEVVTGPDGRKVKLITGDEYREFLVDRASEAIAEAWAKRAPGGVAWGYGYAVTGHSRRPVYLDGHAGMYGDTSLDDFSHYEAGADPFVNLLYTFDRENQLTGAVVNVACPSQRTEHYRQLSADFWHDVRVSLRGKYGDIHLLPQCAAAGDLAPRQLHYKKAQERRLKLKFGEDLKPEMADRRDIAERISNAFTEVLSWASKDIRTHLPLRHVVKTVELGKRLVTDAELATARSELAALQQWKAPAELTGEERAKQISLNRSDRNRQQAIIARCEEQQQTPKIPTELHMIRLGDIAFASNRFELYMDFMHRIQGRSPFEQTFVVQLAGSPEGSGTYLSTRRGIEGGGYGSILTTNQVSPEGGQELVDETVKILKELFRD